MGVERGSLHSGTDGPIALESRGAVTTTTAAAGTPPGDMGLYGTESTGFAYCGLAFLQPSDTDC